MKPLKGFQYGWTAEGGIADAHFARMFEDPLLNLETLAIPTRLLSDALACASNRTLPVRRLEIEIDGVDPRILSEMWNFFRICPELHYRTIEAEKYFVDISQTPPFFDILLALKSLQADSIFVEALAARAQITDLYITNLISPTFISIENIVKCPHAVLRRLQLTVTIQSDKTLSQCFIICVSKT